MSEVEESFKQRRKKMLSLSQESMESCMINLKKGLTVVEKTKSSLGRRKWEV